MGTTYIILCQHVCGHTIACFTIPPHTYIWQESVESQNQLTMTLEQILDTLNNTRCVDPVSPVCHECVCA